MDSITIRIVRPMHMAGERVEPGVTLKLTPLAAAEVLASGRAELVHPADEKLCQDAVRVEVKAALKRAGGNLPAPSAGWPWSSS